MAKIGQLLKRDKTVIAVDDDTLYKQVTIRTNYNGVVVRGTKMGVDIGTKRQFVVSAGQFILSRIDARNGAFGIIPIELDGAIVTNDFWAFDIQENEVDLEFFNLLLQSPAFLTACIKASKGNTNRKRVDEEFFLNYEVDIPGPDLQRQVLEKIAALDEAAIEIEKQKMLVKNLRDAVIRDAIHADTDVAS